MALRSFTSRLLLILVYMAPVACSGEVDFSQVEERATPLIEVGNPFDQCGRRLTYFDDGTVTRHIDNPRKACLEEGIFSISPADLEELQAAMVALETSFTAEIDPPRFTCGTDPLRPARLTLGVRLAGEATSFACLGTLREDNPIRVFLEPTPELIPSE